MFHIDTKVTVMKAAEKIQNISVMMTSTSPCKKKFTKESTPCFLKLEDPKE